MQGKKFPGTVFAVNRMKPFPLAMKTMKNTWLIPILMMVFPLVEGQKSVYDLPFENATRLRGFQSSIRMDEIAATYQTTGNIFTTEITGSEEGIWEQTSYSYLSDIRVVDAVRCLEFYLADELLADTDTGGKLVELGIIYFEERDRMNAGSVFAFLTIGISSLIGVPVYTRVVDLEIRATFSDERENRITGHRATGRGRKALSIYSGSSRKAHQKALKKALEGLNTMILSDPALAADLVAAGEATIR